MTRPVPTRVKLSLTILALACGCTVAVLVVRDFQSSASQAHMTRATVKFKVSDHIRHPIRGVSDEPEKAAPHWSEAELETMRSMECRQETVKALHLDAKWGMSPEEAAAKLTGMVAAEFDTRTEQFSFTATCIDAEDAKAIAGELSQAYTQLLRRKEEARVQALTKQIEEKIKAQEEEADRSRKEMLDLARKYGIKELE
jgi:hypothetical protein